MDDLPDLHRQVLDFERRFWRHPGARDEAIRVTFGLSSWRYQQLVYHVCEQPAALAADPVLVNRVNRLRKRAQRA